MYLAIIAGFLLVLSIGHCVFGLFLFIVYKLGGGKKNFLEYMREL